MYPTGFDISVMNRDNLGRRVDWAAVGQAGQADFCGVRVLDGKLKDADGEYNVSGAISINIPHFVYQPFYPAVNARDQAREFAAVVKETGTVGAGDFEKSQGLEPSIYGPLSEVYVNEFEQAAGQAMLIYSGPWFAETYLSKILPGRDLWIANPYNFKPSLPKGVKTWKVWQDAWNVSFIGIFDKTVCRDRFNGTMDEMRAYFKHSPVVTLEQRLTRLETVARSKGWEV